MDRVKRTTMEKETEEREGWRGGGDKMKIKEASGEEHFSFGPRWSSHRVITRDEGAYMSNLYSA